jgi:hypothetical protein
MDRVGTHLVVGMGAEAADQVLQITLEHAQKYGLSA